MTNFISVAICCDDKFAMHGAMALCSAADKLSEHAILSCYIVDTGISDRVKRRLENVLSRKRVHQNWIRVNVTMLNSLPLPEGSWLNQSTYARILLPDLLPDTVDRIIYLDSDIIVDDDLSNLFSHDLSGFALGACVAPVQSTVEASSSSEILVHLGMKAGSSYFNAGVLLIDVKKWKSIGLTQSAITLIKEEGMNFPYADQDALNILLEKEWSEIDSRWNVPTSSFVWTGGEIVSRTRCPSIIHFTGPKPGSANCLHPLRGKFHQVLYHSKWYNCFEFLSWRVIVAWETFCHRGIKTALKVRERYM